MDSRLFSRHFNHFLTRLLYPPASHQLSLVLNRYLDQVCSRQISRRAFLQDNRLQDRLLFQRHNRPVTHRVSRVVGQQHNQARVLVKHPILYQPRNRHLVLLRNLHHFPRVNLQVSQRASLF